MRAAGEGGGGGARQGEGCNRPAATGLTTASRLAVRTVAGLAAANVGGLGLGGTPGVAVGAEYRGPTKEKTVQEKLAENATESHRELRRKVIGAQQ